MQFGRLTVVPLSTVSRQVAPAAPAERPAARSAPFADERRLRSTVPLDALTCEMRMSADGRTLVYLATALDGSAAALWHDNPVIARVYRDGALLAEHRLADVATPEDLGGAAHVTRWARWVGHGRGPALVVETRGGAFFAVSFTTGAIIQDETPSHR